SAGPGLPNSWTVHGCNRAPHPVPGSPGASARPGAGLTWSYRSSRSAPLRCGGGVLHLPNKWMPVVVVVSGLEPLILTDYGDCRSEDGSTLARRRKRAAVVMAGPPPG